MIKFTADDSLHQIYSRWFTWMQDEKHYSNHTLSSYATDLSMFFKFLNTHYNEALTLNSLEEVTLQDIRAWLATFKNQNYQISSYARYLAALRNFFHYLDKFEKITNNSAANIKIKKRNRSLPKALDILDTKLALDGAFEVSSELWTQLRDYAALTLIYGCGLRISEALSITKNDLDGDYLSVRGKGNKVRSVPIIDSVKEVIQSYLEHCPCIIEKDQPIFLGKRGKPLNVSVFQYQIRKIRKNLGLSSSTTPHAFRHSFATHLLSNGADLRAIQELLGHKNLSTTQIYTAVDTRKILDSYNKNHPRCQK
jgi:integrase/recombinase XerC